MSRKTTTTKKYGNAPYTLGIIGIILSGIILIVGLIASIIIYNLPPAPEGTAYLFGSLGTIALVIRIVLTLVGAGILALQYYFLKRTKMHETKKDYIWFCVLSAVALLIGSGLGAILCLIGGILGWVRTVQ